MLQPLRHIIPLTQTFQVLGIHFLEDEKVAYTLLTIHKKKDEFTLRKRIKTASLETVYKEIQTKHPLLLHFSGVGILHKKVVRTANYRKKLLFKANPDEFYFYELHQEESSFVSFCRKKIIDSHISAFTSKKYHVLNMAIGPFVVYALRSLLSENTIVSNASKLTFSKNKLLDFELSTSLETTKYKIDDLEFDTSEIALFALVIQHHIQEEALVIETSFLAQHKTDYTFFNATKTVGVLGILLLLAALLYGHFTLKKQQNLFAEKKAMMTQLTEANETVTLLELEKKNKETIVATSGLFHPKFLTQYFYEIGNSVEKNVVLTAIDITPLTKKIRDDKEVQFYKKQIHVEGVTTNDADFNNWIADLTAKTWVQKIEIEAYTQDRNQKKSFVIHLYF
ncbi:hypothetical protein C8N46_101694 [Kordia periserrulae]|uniref:Fimbrial assembly protein PilN n=1 Tax=Kordia periserrulae TaxID=701523 RepID=A0A2T6C6Y8_9FLAO|nr:hypothetical protein [Kordia periserrulae]PTX64084.1 hypothetical protein C8N46_101694 [Kordia periserrulae]